VRISTQPNVVLKLTGQCHNIYIWAPEPAHRENRRSAECGTEIKGTVSQYQKMRQLPTLAHRAKHSLAKHHNPHQSNYRKYPKLCNKFYNLKKFGQNLFSDSNKQEKKIGSLST
jgi:hypothetical protein